MRVAKDSAERRAAFPTRYEVFPTHYEVYVEEMGWETEFADHATRLPKQPLDQSGDIWIALVAQRHRETFTESRPSRV